MACRGCFLVIQVSKKFKTLDKEKLLKEQNKLRSKYGLKAHKRLDAESVLYLLSDDEDTYQSPDYDSRGAYQ
jgi:hypothetical protein